jgi:hypothetical protein
MVRNLRCVGVLMPNVAIQGSVLSSTFVERNIFALHANCQRNRLLILLDWAEKEIRFLPENHTFKINNITLDRHGHRLIPNQCHIPDPRNFSLLSTFKWVKLNTLRLTTPIMDYHFQYILI